MFNVCVVLRCYFVPLCSHCCRYEEKVWRKRSHVWEVWRKWKLCSRDSGDFGLRPPGGLPELIKYVYWSKRKVAPRTKRLDNSGEAGKETSPVSTIKDREIDANRYILFFIGNWTMNMWQVLTGRSLYGALPLKTTSQYHFGAQQKVGAV